MEKAAIFDLDFTFVSINSMPDFVRFYLFTRRRILGLLRYYWALILANFGWFHFPKGSFRKRMIDLLSGEDNHDLRQAAWLYVSGKLSKAVNDELQGRFSELKEKGYRTILISASFDFVVEAAGKFFGFDAWFSAAPGKKEDGLKELDFNNSFFFTDNSDDLPLARKVKNSFGVIRHAYQEMFWRQNGISVLWVKPKTVLPKSFLYLPGFYFFNFRTNLRAFLFTYGGFLILSFLFFKNSLEFFDWWLLFLSWLGFMAIHETGYIFNDCQSIQREERPSLRVDESVCRLMPDLLSVRIASFAAISVYFYTAAIPPALLALYLFGNVVIALVFIVHNFMRPRQRIWTYPLLSLSHFIVPLLLFEVDFWFAFLAAGVFYVPWTTLRYVRRVRNVEIMDGRQEFNFIALPKAFLLMVGVILFYFNFLPLGFTVIGFLLSAIDFGKGIKTLI